MELEMPTRSPSPDQSLSEHMNRVAEALLGKPNTHLSKLGKELRYGTNGSLSIDLKKGAFYDHERQEGGNILDLIKREKGLTGREAFDWMRSIGCDIAENKKIKRTLVDTFDYHDRDGDLVFQVLRYEPKTFRQRLADGNWKGGPPLPYHLPALIEAVAQGQTIFICEGERKVHAFAKWGLPATCNAGGSKKWKEAHSEYLRGADVVIVPDNDQPGRDHVDVVAETLQPIAKSIRVLVLPGLGPKGDIIDWTAAGGTKEKFLGLVETEAKAWSQSDQVDFTVHKDVESNIIRLAQLSPVKYDRLRSHAASQLGCRIETLDAEVKSRRRKTKTPKPAPAVDVDALARAAADIINNQDILSQFAKEFGKVVAGEARNGKLLYLVATSRLFSKTMHAAVKGTSAGGKSETRKRLLEFFPPESIVSFTSLSEKFLIYYEGEFKHKILSMGEAVATDEQDFQDYILREMMSEGCIRHCTVQKFGNEITSITIEKEGPVAFLVTTTKNALHQENETRMLSLEIDDSEDQTKAVLHKVAKVEGLNYAGAQIDYEPWRDFQRWLEAGECRVVVPFAEELADLIPPASVRLRRDVGQVIRAIKAHALLHRAHRARDEHGQIVADIDHDYDAVHDMMNGLLAESSGVSVKKAVVQTVNAVKAATVHMSGDAGATAQAVAKILKLDKSAAWRRLNAAQSEGFVCNLEARKGQPGRYRTTGQEVESAAMLPSTGALKAHRLPLKPAQPCNREEVAERLQEDNGCKDDGNPTEPAVQPDGSGYRLQPGGEPVAHDLATDNSLNGKEQLSPVARLHENLNPHGGVERVCDVCNRPGSAGDPLLDVCDGRDAALHRGCIGLFTELVSPSIDEDLSIPDFLRRDLPIETDTGPEYTQECAQ